MFEIQNEFKNPRITRSIRFTEGLYRDLCKLAGNHFPEFIHPLGALRAVRADQRMHTEDIHAVVMAQGSFLFHPPPDPRIIYDMVASDQARKVERLTGRIQ